MARLILAALVLFGAAAAPAAPREPLVVTKLRDPDPNFVPPPPETKQSNGRAVVEADADPSLDGAMLTFGRALGQAAMIERQQVEARCRAGEPANATREQLFAYEAACHYSRH